MRVLGILIVIFLALPFIEVAILIQLWTILGGEGTLALVLLTGIVGASLARWQGLAASREIRNALACGRIPGNEILDGFLIFCAGLFLITPGLLTDSLGFALLIPPCRALIRKGATTLIRRHFQVRGTVSFTPPQSPSSPNGAVGEIIDVEAHEVDPPEQMP